MRLQITKTDSVFGEYAFDAFEIHVPLRRKFAPIAEKYRGVKTTDTAGTKLSKHFTLADFTASQFTNTKLAHASVNSPEKTLQNLQQLATELDPMVTYVGAKPIITHGLASLNTNPDNYNPTTQAKTHKGGTLFEMLLTGEGCGFRFREDNVKKLHLAALYIRACVKYDRMILRYATGIDEPVLFVSVNESARRTFLTMKDKHAIGKGFIELDG